MKLPPIHLDLHISGLTGSNAYRYFKTTESSFLVARELVDQFSAASDYSQNKDDLYDSIFNATQRAIIYSGMCIEATLFDLSLALFGKSLATHVERLDPLGKFFVLARLVNQRDPSTSGITYQALKTVVGERNKLVHSKSTEYADLDDLSPLIEGAERQGANLNRGLTYSYRSLVLLSMFFDGNIFEELRILPSFKKPDYWRSVIPAALHDEIHWCSRASKRERLPGKSDA